MRHAAGDIGSCRLEGEGRARRLAVGPLDQVPGLVHAFTVAGSDAATVLHAIAGSPLPLWTLRQVHGDGVVQVEEGRATPPDRPPEGDALVTARRRAALAVHVADCVPILVADPASGQVAAIHAGWRGTVAGVVKAAVGAMTRRGGRPADMLLAMGPAIGSCCFEVGAEVVERLLRSDPGAGACVLPGLRPRVDLLAANRRQAIACGIAPENIGAAGLCTACRPDLLESHRRSHGAPGRMAGIIAWRD